MEKERDGFLVRVVATAGQRKLRREHAVGIEPGINALETQQAANE
jgi:hypothetical protein